MLQLDNSAVGLKFHQFSETKTIRVSKIASAASKVTLGEFVTVTSRLDNPVPGDVVVVRVLSENPSYNVIESALGGRQARLNAQDILVGVIGARRALRGFVGDIPGELMAGDRLHLLNMGGVIGLCTGAHNELGKAIELEFLGAAVENERVLNIRDFSLPITNKLEPSAPVIVVAGTCMHSGKTQAAAELIKRFTWAGAKVAAAKLSGVACQKDTLNMRDHGAIETLSFHDCGMPSTVGVANLAPMAKTLLNELNLSSPDVIVVELGDGILGGYNVESILVDPALQQTFANIVFCAADFVGAWGGIQLLKDHGLSIDVITGSCTDSAMGVEYIQNNFGISAANAIKNGDELFSLVSQKIHVGQQEYAV